MIILCRCPNDVQMMSFTCPIISSNMLVGIVVVAK
uniref:Uncharacterized protein n=1 Tax=Siphoviridae sp. ctdjo3 TaxID=2825583 RepID=A0A8S5PSI6_9CAUD|nr:MAG TPA: hypothetical protein [Siphoviridae sp. ctdjo3]